MTTLPEIAAALRETLGRNGLTQSQLRVLAGVSQRTLTHVLSGRDDFKLSTLLAVADRLGLELLLVPKGAALAVDAGATREPQVKSRVAAALEAVRPGDGPR